MMCTGVICAAVMYYVYTQVLLTPNSDWGGEGSLGCGIGYGYLHRIPETHVTSQDPSDPEIGGMAPDVLDGGKKMASSFSATPTSAVVGGSAEEGYADVRSIMC